MRENIDQISRLGAWIAATLILPECLWAACGGVLRLVEGRHEFGHRTGFSYLPDYPGFDDTGVAIITSTAGLILILQILALWRFSAIASCVVGVFFTTIGGVGVTCAMLGLLIRIFGPYHDDGDWDIVQDGLLPSSFVVSWIIAGPLMLFRTNWLWSRPKSAAR